VNLIANEVYIDGKKADDYRVERDYCFGMGDNRDHSLDSRYWGFIPIENIIGTPWFIYWSWNSELYLFDLSEKFESIRWERFASTIE